MNRQARRQKPRKRNSHKGDLGIKAQLVRETAIDLEPRTFRNGANAG